MTIEQRLDKIEAHLGMDPEREAAFARLKAVKHIINKSTNAMDFANVKDTNTKDNTCQAATCQ